MPELKRMSSNQMDVFTKAAQMGVACGLFHPWAWYVNADRALGFMPYDKQPQARQDLLDSFVMFWRGCGSHPDDPCETATADDFITEVERFYAEAQAKRSGRDAELPKPEPQP